MRTWQDPPIERPLPPPPPPPKREPVQQLRIARDSIAGKSALVMMQEIAEMFGAPPINAWTGERFESLLQAEKLDHLIHAWREALAFELCQFGVPFLLKCNLCEARSIGKDYRAARELGWRDITPHNQSSDGITFIGECPKCVREEAARGHAI